VWKKIRRRLGHITVLVMIGESDIKVAAMVFLSNQLLVEDS
jgi:hypothetical protein